MEGVARIGEVGGASRPKTSDVSGQRKLAFRQATALLLAAGAVTYLAIDGASYDVVDRQRAGLVVWTLIAFGLIVGILPRSRPTRAVLVPAVAFGALVAWTLLSFTWTSSDERTMAELARLIAYGGVGTLVILGLNRYTFRAAAAGLSLAAVGVIALAVVSRLDPSAIEGANELGALFPTQADRLSYPLDYWNAVGAWGAITIAIALAWSAHLRSAVLRGCALAAVPLAGLAVYLTYSRGGIIEAAVAVVVVIALSKNRWTTFIHALAAVGATALPVLIARSHPQIAEATGDRGALAVLLALAGAAVVCAGAVAFTSIVKADHARLGPAAARWVVPGFLVVATIAIATVGGSRISDAWHEFKSQEQPATGGSADVRLTTAGGSRDDLWSSATDAFEAHPLNGVGPGTYEYWWQRNGGDSEFVRDAHSLYLEQLAELGIVGLLLLLGVLGGLLYAGVRVRRRLERRDDLGAWVAMVSAFVVFLVAAGLDWMWEETALAVLGLGAGAIAVAGGSGRRDRASRKGRLGISGGRAVAVAGALLAACIQVPGLVSTERVRASEVALVEGDIEGARALAEDAIDAEPWAATPHQQLALVERRAGNLAASRDEMNEAIEREPTNWRWPLVLALIQSESGRRSQAIQTFEDGKDLAPKIGFYSPFGGYGGRIYTTEQLEQIFAESDAAGLEEASPGSGE